MPMPHRLTPLALVAVASSAWLVLPMGVSAAEGNASAQEEALIKHGLELREKSDDEDALAEFQRAYRLSGSGRALAQVALAEQAIGRWVDAQTNLTQALEHANDPWIARNEKLLRQALASIQGHTGSLEITGAVPGAEILINNEKVGTVPMAAVLVPAGSVALEVRARGYLPVVRTIVVPARGLARERVVLVAAPAVTTIDVPQSKEPPAATTAPAPSPELSTVPAPTTATTISTSPAPGAGGSEWSNRKKIGAGIAAGGAASLAVGIAFQIIREQRAGAFNSNHCGVTGSLFTGPADCSSRYDGVQSAEKIAIAGFIGAAVLGSVGTFLFLSSGNSPSDGATASASLGLHCVPSGGWGVACAARF
jgi:hypothetical protein